MTPQSSVRSAARSVMWAMSSLIVGKLVALASLAVLAHLLGPADFGLVAFALVYITYVETVADLGTGAALIYAPSRERDAAQITFVTSVFMSWVWFGVTLLVAPAVAAFFHNPEGTPILVALAWSFPLKALGTAHDALCQKHLRFGARFVPELALSAAKAAIAITLALDGFGVWSLVWAQLAGVGAWTCALWLIVPWRPTLQRLPSDLVRPMVIYGASAVAVNLLAALLHHVDLVIVGRTAGAAALGVYQLACKVPEVLITLPIWVASRVLFPVFARINHQGTAGDLQQAYVVAVRYIAVLTIPGAVALVVLAEPIVRLVFGEPWLAAVPILRALAIYGCMRSLGSPAGDVMKGVGRPGLLALVGVGKAIVLLPTLVAASRLGPLAVAIGLATLTAISALLTHLVAARLMAVPRGAVAAALGPGLLIGAAFAAGSLLARASISPPLDLGRALAVLLAGTAGAGLALKTCCPALFRPAIGALR